MHCHKAEFVKISEQNTRLTNYAIHKIYKIWGLLKSHNFIKIMKIVFLTSLQICNDEKPKYTLLERTHFINFMNLYATWQESFAKIDTFVKFTNFKIKIIE